MKAMLLRTLLLTSLAAHGQEWAGGLPLDSASGKIVFRGSEAVATTPDAVLRKRAISYTQNLPATYARSLSLVDSAQTITLMVFVPARIFDLHYQMTVLVSNGGYQYSLSDFSYTRLGSESFSLGGIISREPLQQFAAEVMWQDVRGGNASYWPFLRKQLAEAAEQGIAQLKAAMK